MGAFVPPRTPPGRLEQAVMAGMVDVVRQFARTAAVVLG